REDPLRRRLRPHREARKESDLCARRTENTDGAAALAVKSATTCQFRAVRSPRPRRASELQRTKGYDSAMIGFTSRTIRAAFAVAAVAILTPAVPSAEAREAKSLRLAHRAGHVTPVDTTLEAAGTFVEGIGYHTAA